MIRELNGIFEKVHFQEDTSVLLYLNRERDNYDTHWHTAGEIIMPIENDYSVTINRQTYYLNEKDILFIPPGELHSLQAPDTGKRMILMFSFSPISDMKDFSAIMPILTQPFLISDLLYPEIKAESTDLMEKIIAEYKNTALPLRDPMIYSYLIQFFVLLGRQYVRKELLFPDVRSNKQMEYYDKLNIVVNYISNNYAEDITLEQAAALANFSKFHFSRLFKQFTGQSFYAYLNQRRVKAAESLLLDPQLSITDVALQSGFSAISTFNRVFRSIKECTPSEYKAYYYRKDSGSGPSVPV